MYLNSVVTYQRVSRSDQNFITWAMSTIGLVGCLLISTSTTNPLSLRKETLVTQDRYCMSYRSYQLHYNSSEQQTIKHRGSLR